LLLEKGMRVTYLVFSAGLLFSNLFILVGCQEAPASLDQSLSPSVKTSDFMRQPSKPRPFDLATVTGNPIMLAGLSLKRFEQDLETDQLLRVYFGDNFWCLVETTEELSDDYLIETNILVNSGSDNPIVLPGSIDINRVIAQYFPGSVVCRARLVEVASGEIVDELVSDVYLFGAPINDLVPTSQSELSSADEADLGAGRTD